MRLLVAPILVLALAALLTPGVNAGGDNLRYYDANGNLVLDPNDTLYRVQCLPETSCGAADAVRPGWLRLSSFGSFGPGTVVQAGDPDLNLGVTAPHPILP